MDLANMGFVCLRSAAEWKALRAQTFRICGNSRLREPINQGCRQRLTPEIPIPGMLAPRYFHSAALCLARPPPLPDAAPLREAGKSDG